MRKLHSTQLLISLGLLLSFNEAAFADNLPAHPFSISKLAKHIGLATGLYAISPVAVPFSYEYRWSEDTKEYPAFVHAALWIAGPVVGPIAVTKMLLTDRDCLFGDHTP